MSGYSTSNDRNNIKQTLVFSAFKIITLSNC